MNIRQMAKASPIGSASLLAITIVALCCLAFRVIALSQSTAFPGQWSASLIAVAYVLFSPAVACCLYSIVFERPKAPGLAGLVMGLLTVVVGRESVILLDGLLLLPFWFIAAAGVARFLRSRRKISANS